MNTSHECMCGIQYSLILKAN